MGALTVNPNGTNTPGAIGTPSGLYVDSLAGRTAVAKTQLEHVVPDRILNGAQLDLGNIRSRPGAITVPSHLQATDANRPQLAAARAWMQNYVQNSLGLRDVNVFVEGAVERLQ